VRSPELRGLVGRWIGGREVKKRGEATRTDEKTDGREGEGWHSGQESGDWSSGILKDDLKCDNLTLTLKSFDRDSSVPARLISLPMRRSFQ
jgi:hypothetical protein